LLSGALLAVLVRWKPFVAAVRQHPRIVLAIFFTLLVGAGVMQLPWIPFGTFHYLLLAFLYSSFVLIAFMGSSPLLKSILGSPVLVWFGQLSYGIYMFHQVVHGLLYGFLRQGPPQIHTLADAGITLLSLCITLVLATLSYRFFESPLIRLAHRVRYSGKPQQISTQEAASNAA
jgi:peptidoglycan/LPS O-acetylase OafA/YrhL